MTLLQRGMLLCWVLAAAPARHPQRLAGLIGHSTDEILAANQRFYDAFAQADLDPGPFLYVHPTTENCLRWVKQKWKARVRSTSALQRLFGLRPATGEHAGVPQLRQRPGLLQRHVQFGEARDRLFVQRQGFGQQAQFEVGIGELLLGHRQVLRHVQLLVGGTRAFEASQRIGVAPRHQRHQRSRLVGHGTQHRQRQTGQHAHEPHTQPTHHGEASTAGASARGCL